MGGVIQIHGIWQVSQGIEKNACLCWDVFRARRLRVDKPPRGLLPENSRRLWLFPGSLRKLPREIAGKFQENDGWFFYPTWRKMPEILAGTWKGKPAALPCTLPPPSVQAAFWNRQFQPSRVFPILRHLGACVTVKRTAKNIRLEGFCGERPRPRQLLEVLGTF